MIMTLERLRLGFDSNLVKTRSECLAKTEHYALYITNKPHDLVEAFHLRFKVFFQEFSSSSFWRRLYPIDRDKFDSQYMHIVVKHLPSEKIIGAYRARVSDQASDYYCQSQFNLDHFLKNTKGRKCEVGRACVDAKHRNGIVLKMLFYGIVKFSQQNHADYIVGQSGWERKKCDDINRLYDFLKEENALIEDQLVTPREQYAMQKTNIKFAQYHEAEIPALIKLYVKVGSKVFKTPSFDPKMDCFNFFTVLNLKNVNEKVFNKFKFLNL